MRIWLVALLVAFGCKLLDIEDVGPLRIGMRDAEVASAIGTPAQRSPVLEDGATGPFVSEWTFSGIALHMTGSWSARCTAAFCSSWKKTRLPRSSPGRWRSRPE